MNYTPEQIKDISEREKKCLEFLKENQLTPSAVMQKVNIGQDIFVDKVTPYLQDLKFKPVENSKDESIQSPIQPEVLKDDTAN